MFVMSEESKEIQLSIFLIGSFALPLEFGGAGLGTMGFWKERMGDEAIVL